LGAYYSGIESDEIETIRFLSSVLAAAGQFPRAVVFGSGPTLHHALPLASCVAEIHLADFLQENLDEIRLWLAGAPEAHDWTKFVRYVLECEGSTAVTTAQVLERERLLRRRVTRLITADAADDDPLGISFRRVYPLVVSCYCADSATDSHSTWARYTRNIASLAAPGGMFVTAALRNASFYLVGDKRYPSANVGEEEMRWCLESLVGLDDVLVEASSTLDQAGRGYTGIVLACGRTPTGSVLSSGNT
jgi:hypothetical protein